MSESASRRKICVATGSRAEYGLLKSLLRRIQADKNLMLQLLVTGAHLSEEFGLTYREIADDGFSIDKKVEILRDSDEQSAIARSMGLGMVGFSAALDELEPDILVVLGDRYEMFSVAATALVLNIPIAHIHGGELTEGSIDDVFRHSITKMSALHFAATETYKHRIIQLGENPNLVFKVGALSLEDIEQYDFIEKEELEASVGLEFGEKCVLVSYHPETVKGSNNQKTIHALINALNQIKSVRLLITKSNADYEGRMINKIWEHYVESKSGVAVLHASLGRRRYLSALKHVNGIIGNSSSGIIEAPSLKTGTVNIGTRQLGRIKANSVIDCKASSLEIRKAIEKLFSSEFIQSLETVDNPYFGQDVSKTIVSTLKNIALDSIESKSFFDLRSNHVH